MENLTIASNATIGVGQLLFDFTHFEAQRISNTDISCIQKTLPELFPLQQEDVRIAEERFSVGKGILFTNGTGTGKTFVGLGIAKRFILNEKPNIIIIVPTDQKVKDWISEGQVMNLQLYQLKNSNDYKNGISITTYANFYQNENLTKINYDLVIYDESHYLLQNAQGDFTAALWKHKQIVNLPSEFDRLFREQIRQVCLYYNPECKEYLVDKDKFEKLYQSRLETYLEKTKVVFLSATPFAYHKSLMIGDGTLWDVYEQPKLNSDSFTSYNEPGPYEKFFISNFGYSMKYNKLNRPDACVDIGLMERQFHEKYKEKGIISGRQIKVKKDYSREFIIVNSNIGAKIDEGKSLLSTQNFKDNYPCLYKYNNRKFNYNYTNQLLECIKAQEVSTRIQQHLDLNRKIVIFHNYNNSLPSHPFKFEARKLIKKEEGYKDYDQLIKDIEKFENDYPELINLNLDGLANTRKTINTNFSNVLEFNGTVSKKKRKQNLEKFNDPNSGFNIILIQTKAGKEGISLHDIIGNKQRVLITLGLPTAPTDAIQIEGRTYRMKVMSNAIYEYITLQTNFERYAFAEKVATRSRTAENLAMGNKARNLEVIFTEGYLNAHDNPPSLTQGTGGKERDLYFEEVSEFQKSKTYYFSILKKTSKNKSREGNDYFSTPEPLGYKMTEWLNIKPGDRLLEPSAGHGAIGRFFPNNTENTFIEASYNLCSKLALNVNGQVDNMRFEDLSIWNKFNGIAMNPPFGKSSKLAMEHIDKASNHLYSHTKSRLIAIVPNGSSMEKRLNTFLEDKDNRNISLTHEILLPSIVFKRAATAVYTKIIILENNSKSQYKRTIDLSYIVDINNFFDEIEHLTI